MGAMGRTLALASLLAASAAAAQEVVKVRADVVLAMKEGDTDDPPSLGAMKQKMQKSGLTAFTSLKRLSSQELGLALNKEQTLKLPNDRKATVKLEKLKEDSAHIRASVEKLFDGIGYKLGREGSLFINAGGHQGGTLVLVLSPINPDEQAKPEEKPQAK